MTKQLVMIVDDNEDDRYLLKRLIKKLEIDIDIVEAADGTVALDFLVDFSNNKQRYGEGFPPALIFLDINMPLMDGFEFLEAFSGLRTQSNNYKTSIFIMFSSSERDEDKEKAASYEFVEGFVVKGDMSKDKLKSIISNIIKPL